MHELIQKIREKLRSPSLGDAAHNPMIGYKRAEPFEARLMDPPAKESGVMMLLFQRNEVWHTLFMMRPDGKGVHSNQLSFPGGKLEPGENWKEAALRETFEEIGVKPDDIEIIGLH